MADALLKTPLYDWHVAHSGRMVDFAGWSMPIQYGSIVEEHSACRNSAALFDVSHMGRLVFSGPGAESLLDRLLTRKVAGMGVGKVRYSLVCRENGGILDDVLAYRLLGLSGPAYFMVVVNGSNRLKILEWVQSQASADVAIVDRTQETAMIAIQGPKALEILGEHVGISLPEMGYYTATVSQIGEVEAVISRTGYTGEDGCEVILPAEHAVRLWSSLERQGAKAVGLGARDTLRLEAGMPLYGHELSEEIDPFQAGLDFAVNLQGREFSGRSALEQAMNNPARPKRVGLAMDGRRPAREKYGVFRGDEPVGEVTSGTFSPTLNRPIAMAYVAPSAAEIGTELTVDVRGSREAAKVVPLPFYKRPSAGNNG